MSNLCTCATHGEVFAASDAENRQACANRFGKFPFRFPNLSARSYCLRTGAGADKSTKGMIMRNIVLGIFLALAGCATFEGFTKDVKSGARAIERALN